MINFCDRCEYCEDCLHYDDVAQKCMKPYIWYPGKPKPKSLWVCPNFWRYKQKTMKKELYYIRGNAERADEVKAVLLEKYPDTIVDGIMGFNDCESLNYVCDNRCNCCGTNSLYSKLLTEFGTELHLSEKKETKFKVGDAVTPKNNLNDDYFCVSETWDVGNYIGIEDFCHEDFRLATPEEIDKWNKEKLHPNHLHYSQSGHKIKHWFLPFDRVLVRCFDDMPWRCDLFSHYDDARNSPFDEPYRCIGDSWAQCIPYNEKTTHLLGTEDNYEEEAL